ncbi:MAG: 6-bladed beta-propeller, partial [Proteobacteria bacterium]|nr:6-bladed beta-propeller [Pseudomonadota bacterium]
GRGQFYFPRRVVTDKDGQIYVLDLYHGIQVFKKSG